MAHSPASAERRANLIREMARQSDKNRSRASNPASPASSENNEIDTHSMALPALPGPTPSLPMRSKSGPDFGINTSALRRAFPDFSQYGSSDDGSIEMGRGHVNNKHDNDDPSESMSLNIGSQRYRVTGTPPLKPRKSNAAEQGDLKQQPNFRRSVSQKENQDPRRSRLQARADSDDDASLIEQLPPSVDSKPRGSRFGTSRGKPLASLSLNNGEKVTAFEDALHNGTFNSSVNAGTHQSFALPDLPNITELVSGVRQDGTPLFTRSAKSRSKFANPGSSRRSSTKLGHAQVEDVPIPAEEKALYLSLQLLQEKVASLEKDRDAATKKVDDYELEVLQLKSRLEEAETQHNDSGVGFDAEETKTRDWDNERSKFELSMHSLQNRLDRVNTKLAESEMTIKNLTNDRDAAHAQLANAFLSSEELKKESVAVHEEIEGAQSQFTKVTARYERKIAKLVQQEIELRQKIQRREKAINQMSALAKELWTTRKTLAASESDQPAQSRQKLSVATGAFNVPPRKVSINFRSDVQEDATTRLEFNGQNPSFGADGLRKEETFLSFMEGDEVAKLQRVLEDDKSRLAQTLGLPISQLTAATRPASMHTNIRDDESLALGTIEIQRRLHENTQQSLASNRSQRKRRSVGPAADMTSALILPDITMTGSALASGFKSFSVTRPVPVSDRNLNGDDHTLRPAQSPAVALAVVLNSLEAEVAELRSRLIVQENLYNQHDPALSKKRRHSVYRKIQRLLAAIEIRADQIYALYDVLEGQKAHGQLMDQSQVDITLKNIGLDPAAAKVGSLKPSIRTGNSVSGKAKRTAFVEVSDTSDGESESDGEDITRGSHISRGSRGSRISGKAMYVEDSEELPWEGIEATATLGSLKASTKA